MSEHFDEFDEALRQMLERQARDSVPPDGLAERLVANARSGRRVVTPIHRIRRGSRWTAPLLAAAAIVVIAGGTVASTQLLGQGDHHERPAAPVTTLPTSSTPAPHATSTVPRPGRTRRPPNTDRAPADFRAADVFFRDAVHGYALGVSSCPVAGATACRVALIATEDGGNSWYRLDPPSGLHSMFPTSGSDGSCSNNGDVLGVCVDQVVFADARHGYLYGAHAFFASSDGGKTWRVEKTSGGAVTNVSALAVGGGHVYRIHASANGSSGLSGRLQRADIGSETWTDVSPGDLGSGNSSVVVTGGAVYLASGPYAGQNSTILYRSTDDGAHWTKLTTGSFANGLVASSDGAVAVNLSGRTCTVAVAVDNGDFGPSHPAAPGCTHSGNLLVGVTSASALVLQVPPRTANAYATGSTTSPIYMSDDGGVSYAKVTTLEVPADGYGQAVQFSGAFGYVLNGNGGLTVSRDGGRTWSTRPF